MKYIIILVLILVLFILIGCFSNKKQPERIEKEPLPMTNLNTVWNEIKLLMQNNAELHNANLPLNNEQNIDQIVYNAIINKLPEEIKANTRHLRTLYDNSSNRYWIEYFHTELFTSFLWVAIVIIDGNNFEILHIDTDSHLFSGVTPEMGAMGRMGQIDVITNKYGNFYPENYELYTSQTEAYFTVIKEHFKDGIDGRITTITLDLTNVLLQNHRHLIRLVEEFCTEHGLTLRLDNWKGWGTEKVVNGRIFIVFKDEELTEDKLITNVDFFIFIRASYGLKFIVEKQDGIWKITERGREWIS